jgi:dipeptidyl aminopeptidase/acylaminoacyl peptidase
MKGIAAAGLCLLALCTAALADEPAAAPAPDAAAAFGTMPFFSSVALSADGTRLVAVGPGKGTTTIAFVLNLAGPNKGQISAVAHTDGDQLNLTGCGWSALDRVVCTMRGIIQVQDVMAPAKRTIAVNADGTDPVGLGKPDSMNAAKFRQYDGEVIDWLNGVDGKVLMARSNVQDLGNTHVAETHEGLGVALVDTRTGKAQSVEVPKPDVVDYLSDGRGTVRLMVTVDKYNNGMLRGTSVFYYRTPDDRTWKRLGKNDADHHGMTPLAIDPTSNVLYVLQPLNGRQALYRVTLDDAATSTLVFASPQVDVDGVVNIGRNGRVIGVTWTTDRRHVQYFDPDYQKIAAALGKALPALPLIRFISASADEQTLLVWAGSDVDPGHLYVYDRARQNLAGISAWRPGLSHTQLSPVRTITYPAADGTQIPAYLTLPPGVSDAKGLPALVMPHGGPGARDEWGFDWLAQFFAHEGFVVLQPNFRGSSGYGDQWFVDNGFKSWKTAIGDVCDGGRWLVKQGMADPAKLGIFGWSYGGYAALQANVLAPDLFKAVVAVAPVTDLGLLKEDAKRYTNAYVVEDFVGDGPQVSEGSPAANVQAFKAPVLMFHGDKDVNVDIDQSRRMDARLRDAGKSSELVVYPGLEHSLRDSSVRADMLRRSDAFLRRSLGLGGTEP